MDEIADLLGVVQMRDADRAVRAGAHQPLAAGIYRRHLHRGAVTIPGDSIDEQSVLKRVGSGVPFCRTRDEERFTALTVPRRALDELHRSKAYGLSLRQEPGGRN